MDNGSDCLSGATVLEFHQIPLSIDYTSIVKQAGGPPLSVQGLRVTARFTFRSVYSEVAALGVPAAPACARSGSGVATGLLVPTNVNTASSPAPSPSQFSTSTVTS